MANSVWENALLVPPDHIRINEVPEAPELLTKVTDGVVVIRYSLTQAINRADVIGDKCRLYMRYSTDDWKTISEPILSQWYKKPGGKGPIFVPNFDDLDIVVRGLAQDTHYKFRAWSQSEHARSENFNSFDFWTNRAPTLPELVAPNENASFLTVSTIPFDWRFHDPDDGDSGQVGYELRWRNVMDDQAAGPWVTVTGAGDTFRNVLATNVFRANRYYEWQLRTFDHGGLWSDWSLTRSFYIKGNHSPPVGLSPTDGTALAVTEPIVFTWQFRDPDSGDSQVKADLRYRALGTGDWITVAGAAATQSTYQMPPNTLLANVQYEWQVQTYDAGSGGGEASDWNNSHVFFAIRPPGELAQQQIIPNQIVQGPLGCGHHRVFVYQQGGKVKVGEITPIEQLTWGRQRDDISNCLVDTNGFSSDCGDLLARLRSWQHELVVFRDGVRVWEGPITRLTYTVDNVEIEAKDVMAYVYRRILRQGYDDSYNCSNNEKDCVGGIQTGLNTVVYRASRIIIDALGRGDPNVLPYLTVLNNPGDARQSRVVPDYAKTAWEEVDDLAATAGLDYVTVGRRIILFDTHRPLGKLPEMRDGDFTDPVIVTEYGMNLCNYFGVSDGTGIWGAAYPINTVPPPSTPGAGQTGAFDFYGEVEMLASSYGDSGDDRDTGSDTPTAVAELQNKYAGQASKNISHRWPTPVVVRVPDNTSISPDVNLDINYLVPGVWVPLRSVATLREVAQWQKLDSVTVNESGSTETIQVVMSPAPNGGDDDPDSTGQDAAE
jgi:hypothetical protein